MSTEHSATKGLMYGAGAGVIASLAMAMYAMVASLMKGTGFFTPVYHIASVVAPGDSMMASMQNAASGGSFHFVLGTALIGVLVHMLTGAMYGAVFGLIVSRFNLKLAVLAAIGVAYGALVFAVSAFVALPIVGGVLGGGDPITNMAEMAGWGVFSTEHLLFGLVLGVLVGMVKQDAPKTAGQHSSATVG